MPQAKKDSKQVTVPGERRNTARFPLAGPARFQWRSTDGHWHEGSGVTCDISKSGAFVATREIPAVASAVRLSVRLPVAWQRGAELRLFGIGNVRHTRRDGSNEGYGASVALHANAPLSSGQENTWADGIGTQLVPEAEK